MTNVAGITTAKAKKSTDMLLKCQYIQEKNNGRGVIFATGTPISNSMAEMYVMQRYLQNDELEKRRIKHFDSWASMYGEVVSSLELSPEGKGYRMRSRFAKFNNLPELMSLFKTVADIQTPDMINLPVPKLKDNKYIIESSEPIAFTEEQIEKFAERAEAIRNRLVDPSRDNMLKIVRCNAQKCIPSAGGRYWKKITGVASLPCVETQWGQSHTGKADTVLTVMDIGSASSVFYG